MLYFLFEEMAGPTVVSAYESLREAHSSFSGAPKHEKLKGKLSTAIVDNFLIHRQEVFDQLTKPEQTKQKQRLITYMNAYIDEKIAAGEQIDLKLVQEPIELAKWIRAYTHAQSAYAQQILGTDPLDKPLTSTTRKAKVVQFNDYTTVVDEKQRKIDELEAQLHTTQLSGAIVAPQFRRLNLGIIDIKFPGKGDRSTRHFGNVQPMYAQYLQQKAKLPKEEKIQLLLEIMDYCVSFFPNMKNLLYRLQKGNFQHILTMSKGRRDTLAELIKQDEGFGNLGKYRHNRLQVRKGLFNIYNEVLGELEQLIIKDEWKKESFRMAA